MKPIKFDATNPGFEGEQESQQNQRSTNTTPAPVLGLRTASYCTENEGTPPSGNCARA